MARGTRLLERLKALAPDRIETFSNLDGGTTAWLRSSTGDRGADFMIDTLGAVASLDSFKDAMHGVRRGGRIVNIGGTAGELGVDVKWWMDEQMELIGSVWFTTAEGIELAEMIRHGVIDLSVLQPKCWPLDPDQRRDLRRCQWRRWLHQLSRRDRTVTADVTGAGRG